MTNEPYTTIMSLGVLAVATLCYCLILLPPSWLHGWRLRAVNLLGLSTLLVAVILAVYTGG